MKIVTWFVTVALSLIPSIAYGASISNETVQLARTVVEALSETLPKRVSEDMVWRSVYYIPEHRPDVITYNYSMDRKCNSYPKESLGKLVGSTSRIYYLRPKDRLVESICRDDGLKPLFEDPRVSNNFYAARYKA